MSVEHHREASSGAMLKPLADGTPAQIQIDAEQARRFVQKSRAENTRRAYRADWQGFHRWCCSREFGALPAAVRTVALYVSSVAGRYKVSTLERKLAAISQVHQMAGFESPALTSREPLHSVWAGIVRSKTRAKDKVAPILTEDIRLMIEALPRIDGLQSPLTLAGLRDRALLLIGFAGALRRSEVIGLRVEDVTISAEGMRLAIRRTKTDQEGRGLVKGIRYGTNRSTCPVRSLRDWLQAASIHEGPIFRGVDRHGNVAKEALSGRSVALVVKRSARRAGLDADQYSGHSLRAGFATQAARKGIPERLIQRHTGHRDLQTLREYIHEGELLSDENPTRVLGL